MGGNVSDQLSTKYKYADFIESAQRHFDFLKAHFGFRFRKADPPKSPEWYILFLKDNVAIAPSAFLREPIDVLVFRAEEDGIPNWGTTKHLSLLERARCPERRLLPDQRIWRSRDSLDLVFEHDAGVLCDYFQDILSGVWPF
jgi:hypothetical protein